jgi:microcystin-dependent protein
MRAQENQQFSNISATTAAFALLGGTYGVDVVATFGGGSVKLQRLAADQSTYLSVSAATDFSAAGYVTVQLAPGTYRFTIATATACYANLGRVPGE